MMPDELSRLEMMAGMCLVEPINPEKTDVGIIIPESARSTQAKGRVVKTGPAQTSTTALADPPVAVGDLVYYMPGGQAKLKLEGVDYTVLYYHNLIARILSPAGA